MKYPSPAASEVVKMTTSIAASAKNFVTITFPFQRRQSLRHKAVTLTTLLSLEAPEVARLKQQIRQRDFLFSNWYQLHILVYNMFIFAEGIGLCILTHEYTATYYIYIYSNLLQDEFLSHEQTCRFSRRTWTYISYMWNSLHACISLTKLVCTTKHCNDLPPLNILRTFRI